MDRSGNTGSVCKTSCRTVSSTVNCFDLPPCADTIHNALPRVYTISSEPHPTLPTMSTPDATMTCRRSARKSRVTDELPGLYATLALSGEKAIPLPRRDAISWRNCRPTLERGNPSTLLDADVLAAMCNWEPSGSARGWTCQGRGFAVCRESSTIQVSC
jgi:hypothetical protein